MKRERSWLVVLALAGAMVLGLSGTSSAVFDFADGYSYTQPVAELVMPFDVTDNEGGGADKTTFLLASNIGDRDVTTHWVFWSDTCDHLVDFSICLTRNDTVVVDPRNTGGVGKDNEDVGPRVHLEDVRGTVIVVAYETNEDCDPFTDVSSPSIADDTIVGAFTLADIDVGYSFGNDAFGLGEADNVPNKIIVPTPDDEDLHYEFAIQTFRPESVEASQVILTHLQETNPTGPVVPVSSVLRFATSFVDTTEIPVSLPDTTVSCTEFFSISGDLIPDSTTVSSSGIIRLQPTSGFVDGRDYLYGIVGQAVDEYGASSSLKVEQVSSASPAFLEANGLF